MGSVAFHPLRPFLLSVSGSRHFDSSTSPSTMSSDSDSESENSRVEPGEHSGIQRKFNEVRRSRARLQPVALDASAKLWDFERGAWDGIE